MTVVGMSGFQGLGIQPDEFFDELIQAASGIEERSVH
jgi:hypothetical protein